jgi:hypothetical protein
MGFLGLGGDKVTTTTQTLGGRDTADTYAGRDAGQAAAEAARGVETAGVNPYTQGAMDWYGNSLDQYGGLQNQYGNMGQSALDFAMQTGNAGMGDYMNPMLQQYFQSQNPLWEEQMNMAGMQFDQGANMAGAFGGSRQAIGNEYGRRMVGMQQMADYGQKGYQSARDAAQMYQNEKQRMQGMGMGLAGLQGQWADRASGANRNLMLGGDYLRNIEQQRLGQGYANERNAAREIRDAYGRDTKRITEDRQEGSVLGDLAGLGGTLIGAALPGGGLGSALGMLGIGGGGGGPQVTGAMARATQPQNVQPPSVDPYSWGY